MIFWSFVFGFVLSLGLCTWRHMYLKRIHLQDVEKLQANQESQMKSIQQTRFEKQQDRLKIHHDESSKRLSYKKEKLFHQRSNLKDQQQTFLKRSSQINKDFETLKERRKNLRESHQKIKDLQKQIGDHKQQQVQSLLESVGVTEEEFRSEILQSLKNEVQHESESWKRQFLENIKEFRQEFAEDLIDCLINRLQLKPTVKPQENRIKFKDKPFSRKVFADQSAFIDQVKELCQVDILVSEDFSQVTVSAYDGVARETALRLIDRALRSQNDDPQWIAKQQADALRRLEREATRAAGDLLRRLRIDHVAIEIVRLQGRIRYRTSFGQNVLDHQLEVGFLCGMLVSELGGHKMILARHCGFFHDIGKAIDVVQEGSHPELGGDFLKKYNDLPEVVEAAYMHHSPFDPNHLYTAFTTACDAMSASRPGARRESLDSYIERVESLDNIARQPVGVSSVAVMQAGREIQINVDPEKISDQDLKSIGDDVAKRIEDELTYPGEIRISVVRETQARALAQ